MTLFAKVPQVPGLVSCMYRGLVVPTMAPGQAIDWYIVPDGLAVDIGWTYDGNTFTAPVMPNSSNVDKLEAMLTSLHQKVDLLIEHSTIAKETSAIYERVISNIEGDVQSVPILKRTLAGIKEVLNKL